MEFGYFTLSDNHYENNTRSANQFVADIIDEAIYAEKLGMHSAWIGEHHFSSLGVLSCPDLVLAYVAARTSASASRRRSPCCRCIIRSASPSNGRRSICCPAAASISPAAAATTGANTSRSTSRSTTTRRSSKKAWRWCARLWAADGRISHHGKHYPFDDVRITPKPMQRPIPAYVGSFSKPSIELAARLGCGLIVAPFAAAHELRRAQAGRRLYHETCAKHGTKPGRLMCSYFIHFADNKAEEDAARARQIRYYQECVIPAFPGDPKTAPPSYRYFVDMVERLQQGAGRRI